MSRPDETYTPPTLVPGEGSPAALAAARAAAPAAPPAAAPAPFVLPDGQPSAPVLQPQPDGSFAFVGRDGRRQLIPAAELPTLLDSRTTLEERVRELEPRARATDDLLAMVGTDQRRMQQMQALLDHWQTGRPLPAETFGAAAPVQVQPAARRGFFDEEQRDQIATTPSQAEQELARQVAQMQAELTRMRQGQERESEAQRAERTKLDARARLEAYSFLKGNPRALDLAVRQALSLGASDPRRGLDTIVREVAGELQGILEQQQTQMVDRARQSGATPIASSEGFPAPAYTPAPLTSAEFQAGKGAERLAQRIKGFLENRATGQQTKP